MKKDTKELYAERNAINFQKIHFFVVSCFVVSLTLQLPYLIEQFYYDPGFHTTFGK